jgi:hypothetical protein
MARTRRESNRAQVGIIARPQGNFLVLWVERLAPGEGAPVFFDAVSNEQ